MMPVLLKVPLSVLNSHTDSAFIYTLEPVAAEIQNIGISLSTPNAMPAWIRIALGLYWIGVSILLIRMIMGLRTIMSMYRRGERTKIDHGRWLIYSSHAHLPFSFFNWIFLSKQHGLSEAELKEILDHESAHISALHSVDVLIVELACIFLWPSPVIYFYRKSLRRVHEYLADAVVLRRATVRDYGELLISQVSNGMQLALANHFFQAQLKNRIIMMTRLKSQRTALGKYALLFPVLLLVFALFAFRKSDTLRDPSKTVLTMMSDSVPDQVYKVVDEMPRFPGCEDSGLTGDELHNCSMQKMLEHVYMYIKYPKEARDQKISGRVIVQFIVRKDGTISRAQVVRSIGFGTDDAVLQVIMAMPKWRPGFHKGKAVDVEFTLPVSFELDGHTSKDRTELNEGNTDQVIVRAIAPTENDIYKEVEEMPRFPGCEDAGLSDAELDNCSQRKLLEFIYTNLKYPTAAKTEGITGTSVVQFTIRKDGSLTDIKVVRSLAYGTDEAIVEVMSTMPKWRPAYHQGKAVDFQFTLPVSFKLSDDDKTATNSDSEVFKVVEEMPRFPRCEDSGLDKESLIQCSHNKLSEFVQKHMKYPNEARKAGAEGKGVIQFIVRADGQLTDGKVVRSIGYGTDQVMMDIFKAMQEMPVKWRPGYQGGKVVDVQFTLPLKFALPK